MLTRLLAAYSGLRHRWSDVTAEEWRILNAVQPYTMTSRARVLALIRAVAYLTRAGIPGDLAECGVWRGGSSMAMALALRANGDTSRTIWLYDTFRGMTAPTDADVDVRGSSAQAQLQRARFTRNNGMLCIAGREDVEANIRQTGYPADRVRFVEGPVEATLEHTAPDRLAMLRLDTDFYASTMAELCILYPRLSRGGVLILDDYGHWQGARRAVDEYFAAGAPLLQRVDYSCRLLVKPHDLAMP